MTICTRKTTMSNAEKECNLQLLERYFDGELKESEEERIKAHIDSCEECRAVLHANRSLSRLLAGAVARAKGPSMVKELTSRLEPFAEMKKRTAWQRFREGWKAKRLTAPAWAAGICMVIAFVFFAVNYSGTQDRPSAIITSFTANSSSVMIMETHNSGKTIIWFNEEF